jgi:hypothetical protein
MGRIDGRPGQRQSNAMVHAARKIQQQQQRPLPAALARAQVLA